VSAIVVERMGMRFNGHAALEGVSFRVEPAEIVALVGPNGAGKTTAFELLEGFLAPSSGNARVLGVDPRHAPRSWRARLGLVLQSTSLDQQLTPRETLATFARLFPSPRAVSEVLELIGLAADADVRIGQLSGGQQRRVDLGLGIVGRPDLLFLDEPTTGLDPAARRRTWATVRSLSEDGTTVLLSTHSMEEAQELADRLLVLSRGRLVADTTPDDLRVRTAITTIRYPLPAGIEPDDLPTALRTYLDGARRELLVRADDPGGPLETLVCWARSHTIDLRGLEVGTPSLEEAYLALTDEGSPDG
jgi:ABC-2 type transport system ATP-binding protein